MFCTRCGARNDDSAKFCSQCGASLTDVTWTVREQDPEPPVAEAFAFLNKKETFYVKEPIFK